MFGSWIGLYEGNGVIPFSPIYDSVLSVPVPGNSNVTEVAVNWPFKRSSPYTIVGFAGLATTTAVAICPVRHRRLNGALYTPWIF